MSLHTDVRADTERWEVRMKLVRPAVCPDCKGKRRKKVDCPGCMGYRTWGDANWCHECSGTGKQEVDCHCTVTPTAPETPDAA